MKSLFGAVPSPRECERASFKLKLEEQLSKQREAINPSATKKVLVANKRLRRIACMPRPALESSDLA